MDEELPIFYTRRAALRQRLANAINEDTYSASDVLSNILRTTEDSGINTSSIDKEEDSESSSDEDSESEDNTTTAMIITTILTVLTNVIPVLEQSNIVPRGSLVYRFGPLFDEIAGHMLQMNSFHVDMRMSLPQFLILKQAITPMCERDEVMGSLRNGSIDVGVRLATSRMLAGSQVADLKCTHVKHKSTVYAIFKRVVRAINEVSNLDALRIRFSTTTQECKEIAEGFRQRPTFGVIAYWVGALDGLFRLFSGHKMALGVNCQEQLLVHLLAPYMTSVP
ncbi:hypothetical protein SARC_10743 [Sphaeroforma arctica JP610]|uniref:Uncharacterized protein n=1 Tax=Sphaeroforma arctica JP610 TaxID=667725 RepID=A0A0L0FJ40_9EUKA|nr:hypothetical protein SARC_10743 [Sphaeroforma arctica JP610]KNC76775.1 hypothetical protein SARC_10743 [Sphaeroforma arctica JP610]|eukprot:XP_014150677.1 hypothetical protein SARC_10743 [Sphaeroforma arctica JP610]